MKIFCFLGIEGYGGRVVWILFYVFFCILKMWCRFLEERSYGGFMSGFLIMGFWNIFWVRLIFFDVKIFFLG